MKRLNGNISTMQPALKQRPEVLKAIGVYAALHVLDRMVNHVMRVDAGKLGVCDGIVGIKLRAELDLIQNLVLQSLALHVRYNLRPNPAEIAVKDSLDGNAAHVLHAVCIHGLAANLVEMFALVLVAIAHLPTDESLIDFNLSLSAVSKLGTESVILHCQPDAVKHEPCRL